MALVEALDRMEGTRIRSNIMTGDEEQIGGFGLIDASSIRRTHGLDGRLLWCEIKLSDWVFNAIRAQEVLTLHRDYFRLRKPIERRVYEIARKHCGQQDEWRIGLTTLLKKTGSQSPLKRFRQMIRHLATHDHLPDYSVSFDDENDIVTFRNRGSMMAAPPPPGTDSCRPRLMRRRALPRRGGMCTIWNRSGGSGWARTRLSQNSRSVTSSSSVGAGTRSAAQRANAITQSYWGSYSEALRHEVASRSCFPGNGGNHLCHQVNLGA